MMEQLSMLGLMEPPPKPYEPPPTKELMTRAYGENHLMKIGLDEPDPVEIEVRGVPTLIRWGFGWQTYTIQPPGSPYWSETGFRSFGHVHTDLDEIVACIERYIDSKDGCKGKLTRWWPFYCLQWRQNKAFADKFERATTWDQWGPEEHARQWARHDAKQAEAIEQMKADGIDPEDVWRSR